MTDEQILTELVKIRKLLCRFAPNKEFIEDIDTEESLKKVSSKGV